MKFAEKLRKERLNKNLSQEQLGKMIGISKRSIIKYENGTSIPRASAIHKMAKALDVSYEYLDIDEIDNPQYNQDIAGYKEQAFDKYGLNGEKEITELLNANRALFAGGSISEKQKMHIFRQLQKRILLVKMLLKRNTEKGINNYGEIKYFNNFRYCRQYKKII